MSFANISLDTIQDWEREPLMALALLCEREQETTSRSERTRDLTRYQPDPIGYARDVLGVTLTEEQAALACSVRDHRYSLAKASHAVGKTFLAAVLGCWWYDCWEEHICYVTAPTWDQALGLTFKQIKRFRLDHRLPGRVLETGRVEDDDRRLATSHFIRALNAERGEGFQGEHSAPILIIIEEGPGVPPYIWDAMRGLMTVGEARVLAIGNPTDEATAFGEACRSPLYQVMTISALKHPNIEAELAGREPPFPEAVRLVWLEEMLRTECEVAAAPDGDTFEFWSLDVIQAALAGTPLTGWEERVHYKPFASFQGRVLGEFPTQADENVIPRGWLADLPEQPLRGKPEIGCDPARFGSDRTAVAVRVGPCLVELVELRKLDSQAIAGACIDAARRWAARARMDDAKDVRIRVDVTGGLGAGPLDALRADGFNATGVNVSEKATDDEQFLNQRSEIWFEMRERARSKDLDLTRIPQELREKLIREWSAPRYKVDAHGHKVVEPKDATKRRLRYSPDLADAANLAFTRLVGSNSLVLW